MVISFFNIFNGKTAGRTLPSHCRANAKCLLPPECFKISVALYGQTDTIHIHNLQASALQKQALTIQKKTLDLKQKSTHTTAQNNYHRTVDVKWGDVTVVACGEALEHSEEPHKNNSISLPLCHQMMKNFAFLEFLCLSSTRKRVKKSRTRNPAFHDPVFYSTSSNSS